ncbi:nitroreductase family protein [Metallococcus carri]|uniref:nitroreductase family protein n=1 Tax=Metallococcus carri TaxID=1656884 RepID=UPI001A9D5E07|nr:nitroreductase family protein [Metallococcus carri]
MSPLAFDPAHDLDPATVQSLLEAARWAPSAGNSQPWAFHLWPRGSAGHRMVIDRLAPSSARWAPAASALVVNLAHVEVEDSGMEFSEFADYDLGQAVAHMILHAHSIGLSCRQFRAFDLAALEQDLQVAPGWRIRTLTAIGRAAGETPRTPRRDVAEVAADGVR